MNWVKVASVLFDQAALARDSAVKIPPSTNLLEILDKHRLEQEAALLRKLALALQAGLEK